MKHRIFCWVLFWSLIATGTLVFAHEKTGWIAPAEAKKMKNPVKGTKASIQRGKEMNSNRIILTLSSEEVAKLIKIVIDEEKEEAVSFLKEVLKPQVDQATRGQ